MLAHLVREWLFGRYRGFRRFSWLTGVPLLPLAFICAVGGFWLNWDRLGQFSAIATAEWLDALPIFGAAVDAQLPQRGRVSAIAFSRCSSSFTSACRCCWCSALWFHIQRISRRRGVPAPRRGHGRCAGVAGPVAGAACLKPGRGRPHERTRYPGLRLVAAVHPSADVREPRAVQAVYLDEEQPAKRLHQETLQVAPKAPVGIKFRWPTRGHAGQHRLCLVVREGEKTLRVERSLEILASDARSTRRLGGAWVDLYHHDPAEGKPFDEELGKMTDAQWRELVRAMHEVDQNLLVITMMLQNFTHRGRHKIESEGYAGKAYYPSRLFPGRMPIASPDPLEAILSEADKLGMQVLPGVGIYAFFDYTPASLRWHKDVATELWERYGHHPSFYGWYVSEEKDGGLGNAEEREELVAFFREFTAFAHGLAPDKPVLLAPNCFHLRGAEATYRKLLPHLDIICPFGFHRMPAGDLTGPESATLMQSLCDEAGCHLWMDLESFVFRNGIELHPRPIKGLVSDLTLFPNFEKILHYQFPGLMCAPWMSRRPGGEPAVKLYNDYRRFLEHGAEAFQLRHGARGANVKLSQPPSPRYPGRNGAASLTDGEGGEADYLSGAWLGFEGSDVSVLVDLGRSLAVDEVQAEFLQFVPGGIFLPVQVEFAVGDSLDSLRTVKTVAAELSPREPGPLVRPLTAKDLKVQGRFVQVRARNVGSIPAWHAAADAKAWLFVDEIMVNPNHALDLK